MDKFLVEESLTNMVYRRRYMFENGLGVILLETIFDNTEAYKTWNVFVVQKDEYDQEQDQNYIFRFDIIDECRMRNLSIDEAMKIVEEVKNYVIK